MDSSHSHTEVLYDARLDYWPLLVLAVSPVFPQATTANVVGVVTNPGGVVPAAAVTIRNRQTGQTRGTQTDAQGNYEFPFLQIGEYSIAVEKAGFQKSEVAPFSLSVDQVARIDVKMTIGQTAESVKVSASAILLQTENAAVGTVIDSQKVVELPLNGRSLRATCAVDAGRESRELRAASPCEGCAVRSGRPWACRRTARAIRRTASTMTASKRWTWTATASASRLRSTPSWNSRSRAARIRRTSAERPAAR